MPESAQTALAAAQRIDRELKRREARSVITAATAAAATVGATPIPFTDAALLVPIQMGMMASIAQVYRVPLDAALAASLAATALATNAGKTLVGAALKILPGVNYLVIGVSAAVAGAFTTAMGATWMRVCEMMIDGKFGPLDDMDNEQIKAMFMNLFKDHFSDALDQIKRGRPGCGARSGPAVDDRSCGGVRAGPRDIGRFNLAVFGVTGAGKSTLINPVFGAGAGGHRDRRSPSPRTAGCTGTRAGRWASSTPRAWRSDRTTPRSCAELRAFIDANRLGDTRRPDPRHLVLHARRRPAVAARRGAVHRLRGGPGDLRHHRHDADPAGQRRHPLRCA